MDKAEKWLKDNDPEYGNRNRPYSYLTKDRLQWVKRKEVPTDPLKMDRMY